MKDKRGSHVGMIISFVVFITFIVFLYTVIKPAVTTAEDKRTVLDYIEQKIEENTSAEFTEIGMIINTPPVDDFGIPVLCARLDRFFVLAGISPCCTIAKNETGGIQGTYYDATRWFDDLELNRANISNVFFKVYYSLEFSDLVPPTMYCKRVRSDNEDYEIKSIDTDEYIFEKNIYELMDYYNNHYEALKKELSIPGGNEFEFGFIQSNGTRMQVGNASKSVNVYATETPVQYIDNKANILSGYISVKVW